MNEQIAKLASQAGFDVGMHDGMILGNFSDMHKCQKLAELIINECISTCATDKLGKTASAEDLIKEHFGVK
jgi:hypothetical protein